jgi:hypothetical protein
MNEYTRSLPRSVMALALIACLLCLPTLAGIQQSVAGHWEGSITTPGGGLRISVDFATGTDGKLSATITIPQQGAQTFA